MKKLITLILVLLLLSALPFSAAAAIDPYQNHGTETQVVDDADLLTASEEAELQKLAEQVFEETGMKAVLVTTRNAGSYTNEQMAGEYYDNSFRQAGFEDGLLLLILTDDSEWCLVTHGKAEKVFKGSAGDDLFDTVRGGYRNHQYFSAFQNYFSNIKPFIERYESKRVRNIVFSVVIALLIGFLCSLIPMARLKAQVNTVRMNSSADNYVQKNGLKLYVNRDIYLYTNTTYRVIETQRSSGGGGGGGSYTSSSGSSYGVHGGKI